MFIFQHCVETPTPPRKWVGNIGSFHHRPVIISSSFHLRICPKSLVKSNGPASLGQHLASRGHARLLTRLMLQAPKRTVPKLLVAVQLSNGTTTELSAFLIGLKSTQRTATACSLTAPQRQSLKAAKRWLKKVARPGSMRPSHRRSSTTQRMSFRHGIRRNRESLPTAFAITSTGASSRVVFLCLLTCIC